MFVTCWYIQHTKFVRKVNVKLIVATVCSKWALNQFKGLYVRHVRLKIYQSWVTLQCTLEFAAAIFIGSPNYN